MSFEPRAAREFCEVCKLIDIEREAPHLRIDELKGRDCPCCLMIYSSFRNIRTSQTVDGYPLDQVDIISTSDDALLVGSTTRRESKDSQQMLATSTTLPESDKTTARFYRRDDGSMQYEEITYVPHGSRQESRYFDIFSRNAKGEGLPIKLDKLELYDSPSSQEGYALMKGWIKDCVENHPGCLQAGTLLPTRVLDLLSDDPVLIETSKKEARYTILSYCWGVELPPKTTRDTEAQMRRRIKFSELPATFRDAITITRELGIRYLWIDSLCIIQDSVDDWNTESAQMRNYYEGAYLTISALSAPDSYQGILQQRRLRVPCIEWPKYNDIYLRPSLPTFGKVFGQAVLNRRGWTLQERLLSTRVIHFGTHELFWECATCTRRESSTEESRSLGTNSYVNQEEHFKRLVSVLDVGSSAEQVDAAMLSWRQIVNQYSSRDFSYPMDKLPAISGLAAVVHDISKYTYIAGCWKEDLQSLLWFPAELSDAYHKVESDDNVVVWLPEAGLVFPERAQSYRAPTWSWVSAECEVYIMNDEVPKAAPEVDARIVDWDVRLSNRDPFGRVSSAHITISAVTVDVKSVAAQRHKWTRWESHFDLRANTPGISSAEFGRRFSSNPAMALEGKARECLMVRIMEMTHWWEWCVYFMLLEEATDQPGSWRRVGVSVVGRKPHASFEVEWGQRREFVII